MMRPRSLVSLALFLSGFGTLTLSCGSDELTKSPDDDTGEGGASAGKGGRGGSGGLSGGGGRAGSIGTGGSASPPTNLGKACTVDVTNCGENFECVQALDIPGGVCTADCTTDEECQALGPDGACLADICFEGCSSTGIGAKCHGREDMSCRVYDVIEGAACTGDGQCNTDERCLSNVCVKALTACLPSCASDADCENGVCDVRSGACAPEHNGGKPLGAKCTPGLPREQEECDGFCVRLGPGPDDAFCSGYCRWTEEVPGCGYDANSPKVGAACLFPTALLPDGNEGDSGFCGQLCDCDADCENPTFRCIAFGDQQGVPLTVYGRRGGCTTFVEGDPNIPVCESSGGGAGAGGGGAGGESGGASGSGGTGPSSSGAGGEAGTPSEGGTGGSPASGDSGSGGSNGGG